MYYKHDTSSKKYIGTGTIQDNFPNCLEMMQETSRNCANSYIFFYLKCHGSNNFPAHDMPGNCFFFPASSWNSSSPPEICLHSNSNVCFPYGSSLCLS